MASSSKNHFFATIIISNRGKSGYYGLTFFFQSNIFFFFWEGWNVAYVSDRFDVILKFLMEEKKNFPPKMMRINAWIVIF